MGVKTELSEKILTLNSGRVVLARGEGPVLKYRLRRNEKLTLIVLPKGTDYRKEIKVSLEGEGASAEILGINIGREKNRCEMAVDVIHKAKNTTALTSFRGVLFDSSVLNFSGLIKIEKGADKTKSLLENRVLVLGEKARAESVPSLEIEADDVKASHAATVGQADENALFYLQSRGIGRDKALRLYAEGFLNQILEKLKGERVAKEVRRYLWENL
jgi:Fe-S cluster assembly protein SufD